MHVFNHLEDTNFCTPHHSGFLPGVSTVNQLTYIYEKNLQGSRYGLEFRVVFFDIIEAFDRVWHRGLPFKLDGTGVQGK